MKLRHVILIVLLVLVADQALKIYIKTHFHMFQDQKILGQNWFRLHFIENEGMAWGLKFGDDTGKLVLSLFRLFAVIFGFFYIKRLINQGYHRGLIICAGLILAGAIGNLLDSMFYGLIFSTSPEGSMELARMFPKEGGYAGFLHGKVVDMLYFPIFETTMPKWVPWLGGKPFEFFSPVFNIADAAISVGVITILIFQKRFFRRRKPDEGFPTVETAATVNDPTQIY